MAGERIFRVPWEGTAPDPVEWADLLAVWDAIFGPDTRDLPTFPATFHSVHARWTDALGGENAAGSLQDVEDAYLAEETFNISFSGKREGGERCRFDYRPGMDPPHAWANLGGKRELVGGAVQALQRVFPDAPRRVVFISWSGLTGSSIASAFVAVLEPRLPGVDVFISPKIPPGNEPFKVMLDENLRVADVVVAILTREGCDSDWVLWEIAATWGRARAAVPLFAGVSAADAPEPLRLLVQGVPLENEDRVNAAIGEICLPFSQASPTPLTPEEHRALLAPLRQEPGVVPEVH